MTNSAMTHMPHEPFNLSKALARRRRYKKAYRRNFYKAPKRRYGQIIKIQKMELKNGYANTPFDYWGKMDETQRFVLTWSPTKNMSRKEKKRYWIYYKEVPF